MTDYAIFFLDTEGKVASWNAGAQKIKGYEPDEIIGQHFSRFYTQEDLDTGLPARALATVRSEGRFEHEGFRVRKDGTKFWANVVIDALRDPSISSFFKRPFRFFSLSDVSGNFRVTYDVSLES